MPWLSAEADSSNPETLNEIPLDDSSSKLPRGSVDSRKAGTAQRLSELRAEMKANKEQIEQLTEAHRAVQTAVSGIHATQEYMSVAPMRGSVDNNMPPARNASTRTNASRYSEVQAQSDRPAQPLDQPPGIDRQGWVDDEYYDTNPWYGKGKEKPVFSLGKPLPHKSRAWSKKKQPKKKPSEADPEKGEAGVSPKKSKKGKRVQIAEGEDQEMMGKDGPNQNGAGSPPIYDHQPWETDFRVPDLNAGGGSRKRGPGYEEGSKYKVDGEPVGQTKDDEAEEGETDPEDLRNWWARMRAKYPEPLAEFACTGLSVFLGLCATLSVNLSANQETQYGTYETACWAWGFAFMLGIYLGGGVSGAHMNPAISICLSIFRGFPWRQCAMYIVVQFLASITAGAMAYGTYYDAIHYVDPTMSSSYKSFFSSPQDWVSVEGAFFSQFVAGAVMMIAVFSLGDDQNNPPGAGMHALILGFLQVTLKFCLGYNTGSSLNPASDFGPRLVALWVGYRTPALFDNAWWIYGPWAAALTGALAGCIFYDLFIFVGSESPVNYRIPKALHNRKKQIKNIGRKF
ncbi:Uu.00g130910.m01.CDS01 [Anthostomella pinea]|uniref:Uu.00g130910.m01.CDS01 n=1 Tax=Anthostomella pinea TaxID=933095 RepID=A0AAI8VIV2_9PEZI|nr:Uu.00g130910.m01.CDS01 [Anthostomella pinea]